MSWPQSADDEVVKVFDHFKPGAPESRRCHATNERGKATPRHILQHLAQGPADAVRLAHYARRGAGR